MTWTIMATSSVNPWMISPPCWTSTLGIWIDPDEVVEVGGPQLFPVVVRKGPDQCRTRFVIHQRRAACLSSDLCCNVSLFPPGGAFGSKSWQPGGIPSTADWKIARTSSFMGMLVAPDIWHKLKFLPFLRFGVLLYLISFQAQKAPFDLRINTIASWCHGSVWKVKHFQGNNSSPRQAGNQMC